jgi:hypothetical protein
MQKKLFRSMCKKEQYDWVIKSFLHHLLLRFRFRHRIVSNYFTFGIHTVTFRKCLQRKKYQQYDVIERNAQTLLQKCSQWHLGLFL